MGMYMPSPSTSTCRKLRWLTQILQVAHEHVGAPRSSMRAIISPRRYSNHIALTSFVCEPSSCLDEVRCGALIEECDACCFLSRTSVVRFLWKKYSSH